MARWRTFLQAPSTSTDSYVAVDVPEVTHDVAVLLKIADCESNVKLWFGWGTAQRRKISAGKLARLREALDRVEEGLEKLNQAKK